MSKNLSGLEARIGYTFQNIALLNRAVTHRSWAHEQMPFGDEEEIRNLQNESLEFVGDSVLGLAIAEELYNRHPKASEGDLTLMKHHLVSTGTLAKVAQEINLSEFMRVGRGEEKTGGRHKQALLANTLEAVIAAIFFDTGYISARAFVNRVFADEFRQASPGASVDKPLRLIRLFALKVRRTTAFFRSKPFGKTAKFSAKARRKKPPK